MNHRRLSRRRRSAMIAATALGWTGAATSHAATTATWVAPAFGVWTDSSKWSTSPIYPQNGSPSPSDHYDAVIAASGAAYNVAVNASAAGAGGFTVDSLTIASPDVQLSLSGGTFTAVSGINVASPSTIFFDAFSTTTLLRVASGALTLASGATITTRGVGGTISGNIVNNGTISCELATRTLNLNGGSILNNGTLRASGTGATLNLAGTSLTNHGTINADSLATVNIIGAATSNTWTSDGAITATNFGAINLGGTFTLPVAASSNTGGSINITGTLVNTPTSLVLNALTGSWGVSGSGRMVGGTLATSGGATLIGRGGTLDSVNNLGDVSVTTSGGIHLTGTWTNSGTISAANGLLDLASAGVNNGTIATSANAVVNLGALPTGSGTMNFTDSTVNITGTFTPAQLTNLPLHNSPLVLSGGTIDATGTTLTRACR